LEGFMAVFDVSLSIQEKEMSAIIGPNGAGKTTLFNLISGFIYHLQAPSSMVRNRRKNGG
jgi:ABC-type branched-subunit amino acid transport system ATPase component